MNKKIETTLNETIRLCDSIVDQIETRREIDSWLAQARRDAEIELRIRTGFTLRSVLRGGV